MASCVRAFLSRQRESSKLEILVSTTYRTSDIVTEFISVSQLNDVNQKTSRNVKSKSGREHVLHQASQLGCRPEDAGKKTNCKVEQIDVNAHLQ